MKRSFPAGLAIFGLIVAGCLTYLLSLQVYGRYLAASLQGGSLNLPVPPIVQSRSTSCGEAAVVMAYNYAHPQTPLDEQAVIEYAAAQGYFTEDFEPFTSPAHMVKIAGYFADDYSTGTVIDSGQGLVVLLQELQNGYPVIIDVRTRLDDPRSAAHFVLVTGISADPNHGNAIMIHYNDPLTGTSESAAWAGRQGIWNAWQHNGDPGGSGWWLVISRT
jgi:hypothetical protein